MDLQERICQAGDQGLVGEAVRSVSPPCPRSVPGMAPTLRPRQPRLDHSRCPGFVLLSVPVQFKWESQNCHLLSSQCLK